MSFQNLMEDIVASVVDEVLKNDKELKSTTLNREDIIAYVLNRIPPRYVTSERGILHGLLNSKYKAQERTDILICVHEAIEVVKNRREGEAPEEGESSDYFIHIVGEVLEESTFTMIPDVEVTLLHMGKPAAMSEGGWKNPTNTHRATKGYYHFSPSLSEKELQGGKLSFSLLFRHPKLQERTIDLDVEFLPEPGKGQSHIVPIVLLQVKEGIDTDFLYQE